MHTPFFKQIRFIRIYNGMPSFTLAMNFTAEDASRRVDRPLPEPRMHASRPAPDSHVAAWSRFARPTGAFAAVLALHLAAAWALYDGLRAPALELVVPVQMLAELVEAQAPVAPPPPTPAPPRPAPPKPSPPKPVPPKPAPAPVKLKARPEVPQTAAAPAATVDPTPLPATAEPTPLLAAAPAAQMNSATPSATAPASQAPAAAAADPAPSAVAAAPRAPAPLQLPSSDAQYLQNPKPRYPPISMRTGEQGTVMVQVLVTDKGVAKDVKLQTSSGFFRLDNAALEAVARWRFVPGKRAGVPETMWFTVPITFGLR